LHAANFIYCLCDDSLFVYQKILCVYVLEKVKTILHFFNQSPTIVYEKHFRWKWTHFRKIYQGRLSFFWSWRHFLDTSRLPKILEGTLLRPQISHWTSIIHYWIVAPHYVLLRAHLQN